MSLNLRIPFYKKVFSYFHPIFLTSTNSLFNDTIGLYLYKNQLQLATDLVLYSDGKRYLPFRIAFKKISSTKLQACQKILILGGGLGSIAQILNSFYPRKDRDYTIIEIDKKVADWGNVALKRSGIIRAEYIIDDAFQFVLNTKEKFDLICVDVFINRDVPEKIQSEEFLNALKNCLTPNGIWIMNYVINNKKEIPALQETLNKVFQPVEKVCRNQNVIYFGNNHSRLSD